LIKVQDEGIGIPPMMQEIIFDKFTKAGRKGTAGEKSFGLGMSIVKQIVNLHEGSIWVESDEEKGTTVFIELKSAI
jgi:two-component system sensor histidine kinase VicK